MTKEIKPKAKREILCEDCGDECKRRKKCPHCGYLVCVWCWHHIHSLNLGRTA